MLMQGKAKSRVKERERADVGASVPDANELVQPVCPRDAESHILLFRGLNEGYCRCFVALPQSTVHLLWVLVKNSVRKGGGWCGHATACFDRD